MILTHKILHEAGSYGGNGFNAAQLKLLGLAWPPRAGWLRRLVGSKVEEATWAKVLALRGVRTKVERAAILDPSPELPAVPDRTEARTWTASVIGPGGRRITIECESRMELFSEVKAFLWPFKDSPFD